MESSDRVSLVLNGSRMHNTGRGRIKNRIRGLTLVETMISTVLVLVGILLGTALYSASSLMNRQAAARSVAYAAARQQLEILRAQDQSNRLTVSDQAFPIPQRVLQNFPGGSKGVKMEGRYSVAPVSGSTTRQQVIVTISWRNASNTKTETAPISEVSLSAIVAMEPTT